MSQKIRLLSFSSLAAMAGFSGFRADADKPADPPAADPPAADPPANPAPADPAPADPPAKDPPESEEVEQVLATDAVKLAADAKAAGHAAGVTEGFAAANARMKAVLESKEGKANVVSAAFMLCNTTASADGIIAHLATLPATNTIGANTPLIDLTGGAPATGAKVASEPGADPDAVDAPKLWAGVQAAENSLTKGGINLAG